MNLFLQKSFNEVSLNEIIQQSGLSKGAFYHYFDSKDALFRATAEYFFANLVQIEYDKFPTDSLKAFCNAYMESMDKLLNIKLPFNLKSDASGFKLAIETSQKYPEFFEQRRVVEFSYWQKAVTAALASGEIGTRLPAPAVTSLFINVCNGLILIKATARHDKTAFIEKLRATLSDLYDLLGGEVTAA